MILSIPVPGEMPGSNVEPLAGLVWQEGQPIALSASPTGTAQGPRRAGDYAPSGCPASIRGYPDLQSPRPGTSRGRSPPFMNCYLE